MKLSIHKQPLIIKCCANNKKKCNSAGNPKYDAFAKKVFDKRKIEISSIGDSLKEISNREITRVRELYDTHVEFIKSLSINDDIKNETIRVQDTDSLDLVISPDPIDRDINDDYFQK